MEERQAADKAQVEAIANMFAGGGRRIGRTILDFALPPRCPGCGEITAEVHLFCNACWSSLHFLTGGCSRCGTPLEPIEEEVCEPCAASSSSLARSRAAVAYGDIPRSLAMRLKYGRKIALARTMATYMRRPLAELAPDALLVPVPLHRWRLWSRGFNQALLIARALDREVAPDLLRRSRSTPRLKGMSAFERRATVRGAFEVRPGADLNGRNVILIDDVVTTGSTGEACAKSLRKAGAKQVELLAWARVLR